MNTFSAKTGWTASAATLAPLIAWLAVAVFGVEIPAEVALALGGIVSAIGATAIAYFVPAKSGKYVDPLAAKGYDPDEEALLADTSATNGESDLDDPPQDEDYAGSASQFELVEDNEEAGA